MRAKSGTRFGDGNEVTELVEVPRSDFEKRDGNGASKDIAESPTAIAGTPKRKSPRHQVTETPRCEDLRIECRDVSTIF